MTALDLIMARTQVTAQTKGMFAVDPPQQEEIVQLMRNNGAKTGLELSQQQGHNTYYSPPQVTLQLQSCHTDNNVVL